MASRSTQVGDKRPWTKFADVLDAWLYEESARRRSRFSRRKLAEALDVSYGAVDNWFSKGTLPEPEAFWALVRVTKWTPEHLAELAGYADVPPKTLGPWDFQREKAMTWFADVGQRATVMQFIDECQREYYHKPKRPQQRRRNALIRTSDPEQRMEQQQPADVRDSTNTAGKASSSTRRAPRMSVVSPRRKEKELVHAGK